MKNNPFVYLAISILFTVFGLTSGFFIFHSHKEMGEKHAIEEANHDELDSIKLSPQALQNLGVFTEKVVDKNFTSYKGIIAQVGETSLSRQALRAPIKGVVKHVAVQHGDLVKSGVLAVTIMRDAIPRPELKLVGHLLSPEQKLRGLDLLGLAEIEKKDALSKQVFLWKKVLENNGYWSAEAEVLYSNLPSKINKLPISVAIIGEIFANGYLSNELIEWVKADVNSKDYFFEISSLILEGKSLDLIKNLAASGALKSTVEVLVPPIAEDFDVYEIFVKVGDHVIEGENLLDLYNGRQIHLEVNAIGSEIVLLEEVFDKDFLIDAVPMAGNLGIKLNDLKIQNIKNIDGGYGAFAHIEIKNNPSTIHLNSLGIEKRTWSIRPGAKYIVKIPQKIFKDVFVVPIGAVVDDGVEKIVFIQNADSFKSMRVIELYRNAENVVLSQDSDIFPGDSIVMHGAFGLHLALKGKQSGPADAHAGHNH